MFRHVPYLSADIDVDATQLANIYIGPLRIQLDPHFRNLVVSNLRQAPSRCVNGKRWGQKL